MKTQITNQQVEAAYDARHAAFVTNAPNKYALASHAMALALQFEAQRREDADEEENYARFEAGQNEKFGDYGYSLSLK